MKSEPLPPPNRDKNRAGRAAAALMGVGLFSISALGTLAIWHLVRRGRVIRERLSPPKRISLEDPERP